MHIKYPNKIPTAFILGFDKFLISRYATNSLICTRLPAKQGFLEFFLEPSLIFKLVWCLRIEKNVVREVNTSVK